MPRVEGSRAHAEREGTPHPVRGHDDRSQALSDRKVQGASERQIRRGRSLADGA
jgi:hypothetical protein